MKVKKLLLMLSFAPLIIKASFINDELAQGDMPTDLVAAYTLNPLLLKTHIRKLCLFLYNARNGIAYRDYSRKEQKYGREESHDFLLDVSLVAQENGQVDDLNNAAEYCAQIPDFTTNYVVWAKDYAMDYMQSANVIRIIADELDWDPETTKSVIKTFWTKQRTLKKERKNNQSKPGK